MLEAKYAQVVFTDRKMGMFGTSRRYTYDTQDLDLSVGDMVVVEANDGYAIGQISGSVDTLSFDPKLLKKIVVCFPTE